MVLNNGSCDFFKLNLSPALSVASVTAFFVKLTKAILSGETPFCINDSISFNTKVVFPHPGGPRIKRWFSETLISNMSLSSL